MPDFADVMKELEKERDVGDDLSSRDMVGRPEQSARNDGSILEPNQRHEDEIHPDSDEGNYLKPDDSDESAKHAYIDKKVDRATGTVTYFYENGVRSIHHPDMTKNSPGFHKRQADTHRQQAQVSRLIDDKVSLSHLTAAHGHDLAAAHKEKREKRSQQVQQGLRNWAERVGSKDEGKTVPELDEIGRPVQGKPETPPSNEQLGRGAFKRPRRSADRGPLENLEKSHLSVFTNFLDKEGAIGTVDGMGTVAVSSDPGVFSPTYGDRSPIKQKKKRSGVAKLDQFLRGKQKPKKVQKFATDVVQGALQDLREYDIMKIDDDKYGEDPRVVDKSNGASAPKMPPEPKQEKQPSETKPQKVTENKPQKVTSPRSVYKEEDNEEFFSLFKDYFEYLDKEQESTDDSRDGEERLDSKETVGSDLD
jgi:hypothetical protein